MSDLFKTIKAVETVANNEKDRLKKAAVCVVRHKKELTPREHLKMNIATMDFLEVCEKIYRDHGWDTETDDDNENLSFNRERPF